MTSQARPMLRPNTCSLLTAIHTQIAAQARKPSVAVTEMGRPAMRTVGQAQKGR